MKNAPTKPAVVAIEPIGRWGKFPTFSAKVGSKSSACILIKRVRKFHIGQRIEFVDERDLRGMSTGCAPTWRSGFVWDIAGDRLYISFA